MLSAVSSDCSSLDVASVEMELLRSSMAALSSLSFAGKPVVTAIMLSTSSSSCRLANLKFILWISFELNDAAQSAICIRLLTQLIRQLVGQVFL